MKIVQCPRCKQNCWWGETELGKRVCINSWASPKGPIVPIDPEADEPMVRWIKKADDPPPDGTRRYISHFATCKRMRRH